MLENYILNDKGEPVRESDFMRWAKMFQSEFRVVKQEIVCNSKVSTVFLGTDHNFNSTGCPILWETMVFGGKMDEYQERCGGGREQA